MTCKEIENLLPGMVDGVIPEAEKKRIEAHMTSCASCRKALADVRKADERVKSLEQVEPPPWLKPKVMARVREEAGQKEGFLRKCFYPLYIKVPIQALATVLIAVVAWNVYKTGEPEFRQMVPPPAAVQEAPQDPGPTAGIAKRDESPAIREKKALAPSPSTTEDRAMRQEPTVREEVKADSAKPAELMKAARPPAAPPKDEEMLKGASAGKLGEADREVAAPPYEAKRKAMKAPAGVAASEERKNELTPAASQGKPASAGPLLELSLRVSDLGLAATDVQEVFRRIGAREIKRETYENRLVFEARIQSDRLDEFRKKLKLIGISKEPSATPPVTGETLTVRVDIRPE